MADLFEFEFERTLSHQGWLYRISSKMEETTMEKSSALVGTLMYGMKPHARILIEASREKSTVKTMSLRFNVGGVWDVSSASLPQRDSSLGA